MWVFILEPSCPCVSAGVRDPCVCVVCMHVCAGECMCECMWEVFTYFVHVFYVENWMSLMILSRFFWETWRHKIRQYVYTRFFAWSISGIGTRLWIPSIRFRFWKLSSHRSAKNRKIAIRTCVVSSPKTLQFVLFKETFPAVHVVIVRTPLTQPLIEMLKTHHLSSPTYLQSFVFHHFILLLAYVKLVYFDPNLQRNAEKNVGLTLLW